MTWDHLEGQAIIMYCSYLNASGPHLDMANATVKLPYIHVKCGCTELEGGVGKFLSHQKFKISTLFEHMSWDFFCVDNNRML